MRTYQGRLEINDTDAALLAAYGELYGRVERTLFAETFAQGRNPRRYKSAYLRRFGLTARQFNAVWSGLKGKVDSIRSNQKRRIDELGYRIKKAEKTLKHLERRGVTAATIHHKKRRLATLKAHREGLVADRQAGRVRLCFGSRKRFHAQFNLAANGYASHDEWRADWHAERSSQFQVLGSKDETGGCQGCVASYLGGDWFRLRLRLPDALVADNAGVKYRHVDVRIPYGTQRIVNALHSGNQALNYRFKRDAKGWRVFVTVDDPPVAVVTDKRLGAIGVDVNADHLALAETDRFGNVVATESIPLVSYGCSRHQADARIGEAIKRVMAFVDGKGKPLVIENLAFATKKAALEGKSPKASRMLSSFAYDKTLAILKARAHDRGIAVRRINPAYTSVIGLWKFAQRYGISGHQAAALVIARRSLRLSERPNRRDQNARALPARNRGRHVWSYWARVARGERAAHAAQRPSRATGPRSSPPPSMTAVARDQTAAWR